MKKLLTAIYYVAAFGMALYSAETTPRKLTIGSSPLQVIIDRQGNIFHSLNGRKPMGPLMLQKHWKYFAHQSKDLQIAMQGKDTIRSTGSFVNVEFSSRTKLQAGRAETEYQLHLTKDNPFTTNSQNQWEVTPFISPQWLKDFEACNYSGECVDGNKFNGKLKDIIGVPGQVRSLTIHNAQGYDLTLEFPDGAKVWDTRKDGRKAGVWFFVHAVMSNGSRPQNAGDRAVLRVNVEVKKIAEK